MPLTWLHEADPDDARTLGRKAARLAALQERGLSVPRGFVVTAPTFEAFVRENGLEQDIQQLVDGVDRDDVAAVQQAANRVRSLVTDAELSDALREEIVEAYSQINMSEEVRNAGGEAVDLVGGQRETEFVAVRSSVTGADIPGAHETRLNVNGKDAVVEAVKSCWASLYAASALGAEPVVGDIHSMAVIVQRMVDADVSASVMNRWDGDRYLVESVLGYGTALSGGSTTPDMHVIGSDGSVAEEAIASKGWKIERDPTSGKTVKQRVAGDHREQPALSREQLADLAEVAAEVGSFRSGTFKLDVCLHHNSVSVVGLDTVSRDGEDSREAADPLIRGRGAAGGTASGPVTTVYSDTDTSQVAAGDIVVSVDAAERFLPVLDTVGGVVADAGGITSNLALLAARLGTPCIVGTGNGTDMLSNGERITLHGTAGLVTEEDDTTGTAGSADVGAVEGGGQGPMTATTVKTWNDVHGEADGAVITAAGSDRVAADAVQQHADDAVWTRTPGSANRLVDVDDPQQVRGHGTVLGSYGGVMRSSTLADHGAAFLALDVPALRQDGDRDALRNAVAKLAVDGDGCETAILLDEADHDLIRHAVEHGIDAVAVPGDALQRVRRTVARAEHRFILDRLREL